MLNDSRHRRGDTECGVKGSAEEWLEESWHVMLLDVCVCGVRRLHQLCNAYCGCKTVFTQLIEHMIHDNVRNGNFDFWSPFRVTTVGLFSSLFWHHLLAWISPTHFSSPPASYLAPSKLATAHCTTDQSIWH